MTISNGVITIGTSPTLITTGTVGASWVSLHAATGGNTVYLGDAAVTTATGMELPKGAINTIWLAETDKLYGIVATSTQPLMMFKSGGR